MTLKTTTKWLSETLQSALGTPFCPNPNTASDYGSRLLVLPGCPDLDFLPAQLSPAHGCPAYVLETASSPSNSSLGFSRLYQQPHPTFVFFEPSHLWLLSHISLLWPRGWHHASHCTCSSQFPYLVKSTLPLAPVRFSLLPDLFCPFSEPPYCMYASLWIFPNTHFQSCAVTMQHAKSCIALTPFSDVLPLYILSSAWKVSTFPCPLFKTLYQLIQVSYLVLFPDSLSRLNYLNHQIFYSNNLTCLSHH